MDYYTSVEKFGNTILVRGYENGRRVFNKVKYKPSLYHNTTQKDTKYKTIHGEPLTKKSFESIKDASEWVSNNENTQGLQIYGNDKYLYQFLGDEFRGKNLEANFDEMCIVTWDIETEVEHGKFPDPIDAAERIQLVSVEEHNTKIMITWGLKPWHVFMKCDYDHYIECHDDEALLITKVIAWFNEVKPDVLTGWNTEGFDNPYFVNRAFKIVGEKITAKMSPWGIVAVSEKTFNGKLELKAYIKGIVSLDYLLLYKKFVLEKQESYRLDFIGDIELGERKVEYEGSFRDFYLTDFPKFVHYNRVDVKLVSGLEDKLMLIRLAVMLAHDALCAIDDALGTVQIWDCIIYNYLQERNTIVPLRNNNPFRTIVGAYVKPPLMGVYEWPVTFDATSLYPSIMMAGNVSPEMLVEEEQYHGSIDDFIHKRVKINTKHCVLANGVMFRNEKRGFIPILVEKVFNDRVKYKDAMKVSKKTLETLYKEQKERGSTQHTTLSENSLLEAIKKSKNDVDANNLRQMAKKVLANGLYGAFANQWFRFYDARMAEGITMTGQTIIQTVIYAANNYINGILKTDTDYVVMSDTDSNCINLGPLINKFYPGKTEKELIDIVDMVCKKRIQPMYTEACENLSKYLNIDGSRIHFKRESISSRAFFSDMKKRYAMAVWDMEGVRYTEPNIKIVGFECVRSDVPRFFRDVIQTTIHKLLLERNESKIHEYIEQKKMDFMKLPPEDIADPTGVNNLAKYSSSSGIYIKGTPIHVKASLIHNNYVKQKGLSSVIPDIQEGNKIKYVRLKVPNPLKQEVIAFQNKMPMELGLHKYVNYDTPWETGLLKPLNRILNIYGWSSEEIPSLDFL